MNVGIIGNNLTSLTLAKALVNKKVNVTLFYKQKEKLVRTNRSIGITLKNLEFFVWVIILNPIFKVSQCIEIC